MKKIKICYITNSFKNCGPCNIILSMLRGIDNTKFDVSLLTLLDDNDDEYMKILDNLNINVIKLNFPKSPKTFLRSNEIKNKINSYNFDIVHIHGQITAILVKNVSCYKVITVHNKLYEDFKGLYGPVKGYLINKMYVSAMKKFDKVIACSRTSYLACKKYLNNCDFINNGIWFEDMTRSQILDTRNKIRKDLNIPEDAKVYIFAGRYNAAKNVLTMLDFFSKTLKKGEYLISLGDGVLYEECKKYNSENIKQVGFKNNVQDYMMASDIYISFSYTEGFPVSIIEALHYGLTLLLSNIDSHIDIINMGEKFHIGEYFINDDFNSFSEKKELISKQKTNGSIEFQNKYLSSKVMMDKYQEIYFNILPNGSEKND